MSANPFDSSPGNDQLIAFVLDGETGVVVSTAVSERWPTALIQEGGLNAALGALSQETSPPLVIVDVADTDDPVSATMSLMAVCEKSTKVVVLGSVNDVNVYREVLKSGAADYLVKPLNPNALADALSNAEKPPEVVESTRRDVRTKIVTVVGARHGVGTSTIAVNIAWILAHQMERNVAVIDFDLQFGTIALALDLEPSHGLREALENPDRIDGLFIASAMGHESERLYVLSAEEPLSEEMFIKNGAFDLLVEALPLEFDFVIVDLPPNVAVGQYSLLEKSDVVIIVSELSLAGMRDTVRMHQLVRNNATGAQIVIVVNRAGLAAKGELPKGEFQRGTELTVDHHIANDAKLAATATNTGRPFAQINKNSPVVKNFRQICEALCSEGTESKPSGFFGKLFGKG